jgi:hypothetical protein
MWKVLLEMLTLTKLKKAIKSLLKGRELLSWELEEQVATLSIVWHGSALPERNSSQ